MNALIGLLLLCFAIGACQSQEPGLEHIRLFHPIPIQEVTFKQRGISRINGVDVDLYPYEMEDGRAIYQYHQGNWLGVYWEVHYQDTVHLRALFEKYNQHLICGENLEAGASFVLESLRTRHFIRGRVPLGAAYRDTILRFHYYPPKELWD